MITNTADIKKHHRIGWTLWTAQAVSLFIAFVMGYAPALIACLILALWIGLRSGNRFGDEY